MTNAEKIILAIQTCSVSLVTVTWRELSVHHAILKLANVSVGLVSLVFSVMNVPPAMTQYSRPARSATPAPLSGLKTSQMSSELPRG